MPGKGTHCAESKLLQKKYFYRLDADDPEMKKFSAALGAYIERHGWSIPEAADQIGIDDRTLWAWLDGETGPMDNTAYEIDDLLGLGVWNHDEYADDYYRIRGRHNHG